MFSTPQSSQHPSAPSPPTYVGDQSDGGSHDASANEVDNFIYLISHDVRASVRALVELPQWIEEDLEASGVAVDASVATSIEMMNRHTSRLDKMLVDLLTYSRVGRMQEVQANNVEEALDEVLKTAELPSGFTVTHDITCGDVMMGNRDIITLLDALVQNGHKHHDRSQGRIHVGVNRQNAHVIFTVSDDGPGIPPEFHERVFGAMRTLRPRDEVEGTGMGLACARKIATQSGGTAMIVPSVFGAGTGVEVRLNEQV